MKLPVIDNKKNAFSLEEISVWVNNNFVDLPAVQRSFVWKPSQIENLWDSLLRGFPIGSLVLSQHNSSKPDSCLLNLLDGQQRVTAICLGFGSKTFREAHENIKVFLDLDSPNEGDARKYLFRVITRSHPWGYKLNDNTKTLDSVAINKARIYYGVEDHLKEKDLDKFFPFDALFPVPFEIFLQAAISQHDEVALLSSLYNWRHWEVVCNIWKDKLERPQNKKNRITDISSMEQVTKKISQIFAETKKMLGDYKIPSMYLDLASILSGSGEVTDAKEETGSEEDSEEEPKTDEIENLFVRLNAGGTPLRGEELNYSILKAHIKPGLQKEIEKACYGLFNPARFIAIAFRLYQHKKKVNSRDSISLKVKPKQFQKTISEHNKEFTGFLSELLTNKSYGGESLLNFMKRLLVYEKNKNDHGLPYLMVSSLSNHAPEVIFMLLYRLIMFDKFKRIPESNLHRRMLGMITLFAWLGKGDRLRDHAKLLSNIWPAVTTLATEQFWSSLTVQRAMLDQVLSPFPPLENLEKVNKISPTGNIWGKFESTTKAPAFAAKMFNNRDLVLYAQRAALKEWFDDDVYELDDTNIPFDWDHIFPNKFCHKKRNVPQVLRDCYNSNGNFRAWPYSLNRSDQDQFPHVKLNPIAHPEHADILQSWNDYFKRASKPDFDINTLADRLLSWSFCVYNKEWVNSPITVIKKDYKKVYRLIVGRNVALCKEWYKNLKIESLLPQAVVMNAETIINLNKWREDSSEDEDTDYVFWSSKVIDGRGAKYSLYFGYPEVSKENPSEKLREDSWIFGIREDAGNGDTTGIPIKENYDVGENEVTGVFTLISHHEESYCQLFSDFNKWLKNFPDKNIAKLSDSFTKTLIAKYQGYQGKV